jgi:5-(carboxyamino)imidazole ribonucleotide synthase
MLKPGQTIGILGGGQLARMLALAAAPFGLRCHIFAPEQDSPAFDVAYAHTIADYGDEEALERFATAVDVITYEFENVPAHTASFLAARRPVRPDPKALAITQDRLSEKQFLTSRGLPLAPFWEINSLADLEAALALSGRPAVLKTRRFGYDGKGQVMIRPGDDAAAALKQLGSAPAVLEGFVPFSREVSVVVARALDGRGAAYDLCENTHKNHILSQTLVPAKVGAKATDLALQYAKTLASELAYVGVMAVEMFVVGQGEDEHILINEIAPRVHNSGHWTIEGAETSQFAQHIRSIAGWPLGSITRSGLVRMDNLVGDDVEDWLVLLSDPHAHLHLYGKTEARKGRKMGHVTYVTPE